MHMFERTVCTGHMQKIMVMAKFLCEQAIKTYCSCIMHCIMHFHGLIAGLRIEARNTDLTASSLIVKDTRGDSTRGPSNELLRRGELVFAVAYVREIRNRYLSAMVLPQGAAQRLEQGDMQFHPVSCNIHHHKS